MSEAEVLKSALTELLERCHEERSELLRTATAPLSPDVEAHLQAAEAALRRLVTSGAPHECSAIANEVLSAVAQFRRCLESHRV